MHCDLWQSWHLPFNRINNSPSYLGSQNSQDRSSSTVSTESTEDKGHDNGVHRGVRDTPLPNSLRNPAQFFVKRSHQNVSYSYSKALQNNFFCKCSLVQKGWGGRTACIVISGKADLVTKLIPVPDALDPVWSVEGSYPHYRSSEYSLSILVIVIAPS